MEPSNKRVKLDDDDEEPKQQTGQQQKPLLVINSSSSEPSPTASGANVDLFSKYLKAADAEADDDSYDEDEDGDYNESTADESEGTESETSSGSTAYSTASKGPNDGKNRAVFPVSTRAPMDTTTFTSSTSTEDIPAASLMLSLRSISHQSMHAADLNGENYGFPGELSNLIQTSDMMEYEPYPIPEANGRDFILKPDCVPKPVVRLRSGIVYDARMLNHVPIDPQDYDHPESPDRLIAIFDALLREGCLGQFERIEAVAAEERHITLFHTERHYQDIVSLESASLAELFQRNLDASSLFLNNQSAQCAALSCGAVLRLADAVWDGKVRNGFALVRPPGHHAEADEAMGFCVYNNIAIAARHLKRNRGLKRILVLDWDIHHGNGTQQAFYDDPNILFISIHRYDNGRFYPGTPLANYTYTGGSKAQGMNINIPWDCGKINDADYMYTFYNLIIPVLQEFNPEIILVSCGFDAVRNDPIGGCDLTPAGFAHMTHLLSQFAGGKVVLVLEGGYHLGAISDCAVTVANALLHHPLPSLDPDATLSFECINTVAKVKQRLSIYWSSLGAYHLATDFPATTTEPQTPCNPYLGHQVLPLWAKNNNDSLLSRQFNSSLSHIIRVYRAAEFEKLNMRPLHFRVEKNMESGPENQTSVDSIIFDAHISKGLKGKVILFVHEKPDVRFQSDAVQNVLKASSSVLVDPFFSLLSKFANDNWTVIDIAINAHFPSAAADRFGRIRDRDDRKKITRLIDDIVWVLNPVYDTFFAKPSKNTRAIFFSGIGASFAPHLASKLNIEKCVDSVVSLYPNNRLSDYMAPVLIEEVTPAQKEWYMMNTVNLSHGYGKLWTVNSMKDSGFLISLGDDVPNHWDIPEFVTLYENEIERLLKGDWWWQ